MKKIFKDFEKRLSELEQEFKRFACRHHYVYKCSCDYGPPYGEVHVFKCLECGSKDWVTVNALTSEQKALIKATKALKKAVKN